MRLALALRVVAIAIALTALADPVLTMSRFVVQPLTIAILDTATLSLPDGAATRRDRAQSTAEAIRSALSDQFRAAVRQQPAQTHADPCPAEGACVVISDGVRPRELRAREGGLGGVLVVDALTPNVAITALKSAGQANPGAVGIVHVELAASGVAGRQTELNVFDGDVLVGHAQHRWPASTNQDLIRADVGIAWTPVERGIRHLTVVAKPTGDEATLLDNHGHAAVEVIERSASVVVYEPQPTWNGTFVRRALESDPRFRVVARSLVSNAVSVGTSPLRLDTVSLAREDARAVVVTAPQLLTSAEVTTLERFIAARGGSAVLLIDGALSGPVRRLVPFAVRERSEANAVERGELKVSEFLAIDAGSDATVLARAGKDAVIVTRPYGQGRVVVSGAVDAWRFRHEGNRFTAFWRALIADAVHAAGDPVVANLSPSVARPGDEVRVDIEVRSIEPSNDTPEPSAMLECFSPTDGNQILPIRLLPIGRRRFSGTVMPMSGGTCHVFASTPGSAGTQAPLVIGDDLRVLATNDDELSAAIRAYGGVAVRVGDERALISHLRQFATPVRQSIPVHPMRSPLWLVPFAVCLSGEWSLRRRQGRT